MAKYSKFLLNYIDRKPIIRGVGEERGLHFLQGIPVILDEQAPSLGVLAKRVPWG